MSMSDFDKLFDKDRLRKKLVDSSLFLMAYELLKSSIVDGVKEFFISGINQEGFIYSQEYKTKVLSRATHVFEASLIFLVEVGAITGDDKSKIHMLREYRNSLAHDLPTTIYEPTKAVDLSKLELAGFYLNKIDNFWGRVEVDTDPDMDRDGIDYDGITSVRSIMHQYIVKIVREEA